MKCRSAIFAALFLIVSTTPAYASEVTFSADAILNLGGDLEITARSGSRATTLDIDDGSISLTMEQGDQFTLVSDQYHLHHLGSLNAEWHCSDTTEVLILSGSGTSSIFLYPQQCPHLNSSAGGGGGGGRGLSLSSRIKPTKSATAKDGDSPNSQGVNDGQTEADGYFSDMEDHFADDAVRTLWERGVVNGKSLTEFKPNDFLTRAEIVKIALLSFDYQVPEDVSNFKTYSDVYSRTWYAPYLMAATENEMISGYGDGSFRPNSTITRAEALKVLLNAAKMNYNDGASLKFSDVKAEDWYFNLVAYAAKQGIVKGRSETSFAPNDPITRGELAVMIQRVLGQ